MIGKHYGNYIVNCDICGEILNDGDEEFRLWEEAKAAAKASGWITKRIDNELTEICKECKEVE